MSPKPRTEYFKQYRQANKKKRSDWQNAYNKKRKAADASYKITYNLRCRLGRATKKNFKTGSAVTDLGCSIEYFKSHIEGLFQPNMSWSNYGEWHLDHIIPLASFDLTNKEQFLVACHYTNYQPLWAKDNLIKGAK